MQKRKKASAVAEKKGKPDKAREEVPEMTIIEKALEETKLPVSVMKAQAAAGTSRKYTKEVFKLWLTLPDQFKGASDRITELLGITDEASRYLLGIKTMTEFAERFGVMRTTVSRWRTEVEVDNDWLVDVKKQMRKLTRNVMGALYRKALEDGDAARVMAWMKIIEDWREQMGIEHTVPVGDGLNPDERAALDKLLAKSTRP